MDGWIVTQTRKNKLQTHFLAIILKFWSLGRDPLWQIRQWKPDADELYGIQCKIQKVKLWNIYLFVCLFSVLMCVQICSPREGHLLLLGPVCITSGTDADHPGSPKAQTYTSNQHKSRVCVCVRVCVWNFVWSWTCIQILQLWTYLCFCLWCTTRVLACLESFLQSFSF